jgi:Ca2+-binding RTX toxin-like protein
MRHCLVRSVRFCRTLSIASSIAAAATLLAAPAAHGQTGCDRSPMIVSSGSYDVLTVNLGPGQTVALRNDGGIDVAENVAPDATDFNAKLATAADCIDQAGIDQLVISGTDGGDETVKMIEGGAGSAGDLGDVQTIIDLGSGNDTVEFMTADTNGDAVEDPDAQLIVIFGRPADASGDAVVDQGITAGPGNMQTDCDTTSPSLETFDCSDLLVRNAESLVATGGKTEFDFVNGQGDIGRGFIDPDADGAFTPGDPTIDETVGLAGYPLNEPNGSNVTLPITAKLGPGTDILAPGDGDDSLSAGGGRDVVDYAESPDSIEVNLKAGEVAGGSGTDTLARFESVSGSLFDDVIIGRSVGQMLFGFCGNDTVKGGSSRDVLVGDGRAQGPPEQFVCDDPLTEVLEGPGVIGDDMLVGRGERDTLEGNGGDDRLSGKGGKDFLDGGAGNDRGTGGGGRDVCTNIEQEKSCETSP